MRARIAALTAISAGLTLAMAGPSWATPTPSAGTAAGTSTSAAASAAPGITCPAQVNRPCAWQERGERGVLGSAQVTAEHPGQLTLVRVDVKIQRAWGSPWETVASSTLLQYGSVRVSTPPVSALGPIVVCATGGPALQPALQSTTCTTPH
ncbi:hypothetical protein OG689_33925 [Kitasatospora sp. NBC_00240]|uniref:hypothetical protein n=1 Tax=Kitasatospora sp. NBC_00240 TaxID=2903567 RepID=UPI002254B6CA|nr:hypothetical protein [Kitasatospora sp. NBC_00240]MCX5214204.1 hypothetical protein [Kitasatospora sp. NBC_00240]